MDDGAGAGAEEVGGDVVVGEEVFFPDAVAGFEIEALELGGDAEGVDAPGAGVDHGAGARAGVEAVAVPVVDGVFLGPVELAGFRVEAGDDLVAAGAGEVDEVVAEDRG